MAIAGYIVSIPIFVDSAFVILHPLGQMEEEIKAAGIILLNNRCGRRIWFRAARTGDFIANQIAGLSLPAVLIPSFVATLVRRVQGSSTVAIVTAASISARILAGLDVNMVRAAQAAAMGSFVFSYFNDSLFWMVNRLLGITDVKEQILVWSVPTTIMWFVSLIALLIANLFV